MKIFDLREIREEETKGIGGELIAPAEDAAEKEAALKESVLGEIRRKTAPAAGKRRRLAMIAAAMVCVFGLAACSAAVFHWNENLAEKLNLGAKEKEYAEKAGVAQTVKDSADTCSGVTVTLRQTLATEDLCYLVFDVSLPDSQVYFADGAPIVREVDADGLEGWSQPMTLSNHEHMTADGNVLSMYMVGYFGENDKEELPLRVLLQDITYRTISEVITVKGAWELECTVEKNAEKLEGKADLPCALPGYDGKTEQKQIIGYELTPLEAQILFHGDHDEELPCALEEMTLAIYYQDGTRIDIDCAENLELNYLQGWRDPDGPGYIHSYRICMDHLIDVKQVVAMEFCGTMIDVQR